MSDERPENEDVGALERMRQKLYAPQNPTTFQEPTLTSAPIAPATTWKAEPPPIKPVRKAPISMSAIFLIVAGAFFVVAALAAAYFLIFGGRSVSTERVTITVDGPTAIASGDTVSLLISVKNGNPLPATMTSLTVDFPETTRTPEEPEKPFVHYVDTVGDIAPGETGQRTVRAVLFGSENERLVIPVRFEYKVEGSNAVFVKEATYEVTINSSPLSVTVETLSQVAVGQPIAFAVKVRSNAKTPLENVAVLAQYPFGFTPRAGEGPLFPVGTLAPGEERTVTLSGTLTGEDSDERVFRFSAGTRRTPDATTLATTYTTTQTAITLARPFLATTLSVNKDTSTSPIIDPGTSVQSILSWQNTLSSPILDGQIAVKLSGNALDVGSVSTYGGFYRSVDSTIIYSRETEGGLARLSPGDTGSGSFSFSAKPASALIGIRNPTITATISVAGRRVGESNVPESVSSVTTRTIKIGTDLSLAARAVRTTGPFQNTGPWPPVADTESTYTIQMTVTNTVNTVANATVSGTLPSYVRYTSATSPNDGSITYNSTNRAISWNAGEIQPGASKTMSFQVALLPSISQRGTSPVLMYAQTLTGVDRFTQQNLSSTWPALTTQIESDPAYRPGLGEVAP